MQKNPPFINNRLTAGLIPQIAGKKSVFLSDFAAGWVG
jgi:hypothetical protein